jgi:membrane protein YqaA with SNARE-associated domain
MDFIGLLSDATSNPFVFFPLLFFYSIAVAIILPLPLELALIFVEDPAYMVATAIVIGLGKMVGAWAIFFLGLKVEDNIRRWSEKYKIVNKIVKFSIWFVDKTGYVGLFILLSIPFMTDTVPIYIYALFNEEGKLMKRNYFLLTNFAAGIVRGIVFILLWNAGIRLI